MSILPVRIPTFIDDVTCGGPKTNYDGEESLSSVRKYVLKHIIQLDKVLANIKRAGGTISSKKCYFIMNRLEVGGTPFVWGEAQEQAMLLLKTAITRAPTLINIDYLDVSKYPIFLIVDASHVGGGAVIEQLRVDGKRHPVRFERMDIAELRVWKKRALNFFVCDG
ncbi:hypothetical protein BM1_00762 [Bipolaris maydis]|nr:hypothetical protein BM1_00762 [Bipolaris maydis]